MTIRRVLWVVITALSLVVLAGGGAVAWLALHRTATSIGLVVVRTDSRLHLIADNGDERSLAENVDAADFRFPAVSPDGHKIAYIATDGDAMLVVRLNLVSGERKELYRSTIDKPFDLAWSPDGHYVNFLLTTKTALTTYLVPDDGSVPARLITTGNPLFFAWRPDSSALLFHLKGHTVEGGRVEVYQPGQGHANPLLSDPGLFQAPAWSRDGKTFFYVAQPPINNMSEDIQSDIVRVSADGKNPRVLVSEKLSDIRIVRAPNSDRIAYITLHPDNTGSVTWGALKVIDDDGGKPRTLSHPDEHVMTFFWSPDGKQVAYLTYTSALSSNGPRTWHVVDVDGGTIHDFATFTPSADFAGLQIFFDAYLFSFSPWSPDGRRLAYGATDGVYVLDVGTGQTTRKSDGSLGMWVGGR